MTNRLCKICTHTFKPKGNEPVCLSCFYNIRTIDITTLSKLEQKQLLELRIWLGVEE